MDAEERRRVNQWMRRVNTQRRTVVEHLQSRSRQLDVSQALLKRHLKEAGLEPVEVQLNDQIDPTNGCPTLHSEDEEQRQALHDITHAALPPDTEAKDWWPSIDDTTGPIKPGPGWHNIKLLDKAVRTVGVMLLGQTPEVIDRVVATILRQQTQRGDFVPVFIIDSNYTDPFLRYGFVIEMVPPPEEQTKYSGTRPWDEYVMDRLTGIRDKWCIAQFLEFGTPRYKVTGLADQLAAGQEEAEPLSAGNHPSRELAD